MAGEKIRYREIDIARGFGIILVVAGHAIKQTGVSARWIRILTFLIYSFHMPLFFLLSGFVAAKILRMELMRERLSYIRDRALRLLVPYFTVSLLYIPVKLKLSAYAELPFTEKDILKILIGRSPDVALWFLFILFVVSAITALFVNQINFRQFLYGAFVLSGVFYWLNIDVRTMKYWFFFLFGIWVRLKFEDAQKEGIRDVMGGQFIGAFLIGIFYLAAVLFWYRTAIMISCFLTSLSGIYLTLWLSTRIEHYLIVRDSCSLGSIYSPLQAYFPCLISITEAISHKDRAGTTRSYNIAHLGICHEACNVVNDIRTRIQSSTCST